MKCSRIFVPGRTLLLIPFLHIHEHFFRVVRFFDDGEVYDHFAGRGLFSGENYDLGFLSEIAAAANGLRFNDECIIEIAATPEGAAAAFAKFMAAMLDFVSWEKAWAARVAQLRLVAAGK